MSDNQMRKMLAVGVTVVVFALFAILNLIAPIFGTIAIVVIGILWTAVIHAMYSEEG